MTKNGLKVREVSATHFSSGVKKENEIKCTRCVIHLLEAKDLLASDTETGKSDPICFLALGPPNMKPNWDDPHYSENGILFSEVKKATIHPKWNSTHTFPIVIQSVSELLKARISLFLRDEDLLEDGTPTYDNLGEVRTLLLPHSLIDLCYCLSLFHTHSLTVCPYLTLSVSISLSLSLFCLFLLLALSVSVSLHHSQTAISLQDVLKQGKIVKKTAIVTSPQWIKLSKCSNMKRVEGSIKIFVSIIFDEDEMSSLLQVRPLLISLTVSVSVPSPLTSHTLARPSSNTASQPLLTL
jgi:hypothetical protein